MSFDISSRQTAKKHQIQPSDGEMLVIPYSLQNHAEIIAVLCFVSAYYTTRFQIQSLFSFYYQYNDIWSGPICPYIEVSGT